MMTLFSSRDHHVARVTKLVEKLRDPIAGVDMRYVDLYVGVLPEQETGPHPTNFMTEALSPKREDSSRPSIRSHSKGSAPNDSSSPHRIHRHCHDTPAGSVRPRDQGNIRRRSSPRSHPRLHAFCMATSVPTAASFGSLPCRSSLLRLKSELLEISSMAEHVPLRTLEAFAGIRLTQV